MISCIDHTQIIKTHLILLCDMCSKVAILCVTPEVDTKNASFLLTGRDTNSQQLNEIEAFLTSKKAIQFIKTNALPSNNKRWLGRVGRWVEEKKGKF